MGIVKQDHLSYRHSREGGSDGVENTAQSTWAF